ncbi:MAG: SIS domain-containing protein [Desulfobacterales bacterium]|nr:SIS domain-containing protein [Desulfobacterales bacterium]MDD4071194.1 SIS domain-containing protein [Desulfobacterales bacterium]MDD4392202.1 SIS domain-containing protein [Desulfobacterales bacterium]
MFDRLYNDHLSCFQCLPRIKNAIVAAGEAFTRAIDNGNRIFVCGNGGSAADAQHFSAEIVGRFNKERRAWPAIALSTNSSILTAVANDYSYDDIFARQLEGLASEGDMLLGISTSGNSANVIKAVARAREMKIASITLLGKSGGKLNGFSDQSILIPYENTARIQEAHIFILHVWAEMIETALTGGPVL